MSSTKAKRSRQSESQEGTSSTKKTLTQLMPESIDYITRPLPDLTTNFELRHTDDTNLFSQSRSFIKKRTSKHSEGFSITHMQIWIQALHNLRDPSNKYEPPHPIALWEIFDENRRIYGPQKNSEDYKLV